jgi:hypothetical protein
LGRCAGAHKFLDALRPYTVIADPVSLTQDFTHLKSLNREDQQKQLSELAARAARPSPPCTPPANSTAPA